MNTMKRIEVLLVEDDPADVEMAKEGLALGKVAISLNVVEDGAKAMEYLRRQGPYGQAARPDLVLLDLNLPRMDGREVLRQIKSDDNLRSIPVVVLTTSDAEADIMKCYDSGANCYITKPIGFEAFVKVVQEIESFWFTVVRMPPNSSY